MPRLARTIAAGCAHHITQRGHNRQDVFLVDGDYQAYLQFLREQADKDDLHVVGSCLMGNDVHLVAIPRGENALAKAVGRTHFRYAR